MTAPETEAVSILLAQLRGEIGTGLAEIKGSLSVLVERTTRTDADLKQLRTDTEEEIKGLRADVEALKEGRWPLAQLGVILTIGALVAAVIALFVTG
ncbi:MULTISPECIES: hypothetical protein [unclassified Streptomyces]|uniref:hypothetical protein n=1 Tax=unclassified Streptomyces TaxID=2593676 RepID=UPI00202459D0|nr:MULTISPECIES: hypothetical protein [unclassified Streptomyces]MCX4550624.1 hypothetical protein [Streptomyces sp. NBC_01500]WSC22069.1 hypothetical protein OIE60_21575 [Streptomyces sp. NBC_01766]